MSSRTNDPSQDKTADNRSDLEIQRDEATIAAAKYIRRQCPHDIAGKLVLAAFAQDSIDHRYGARGA